MIKTFAGSLIVLIAVTLSGPAAAWSHANRWGGSTSHSEGSTTRTTGWGGSETHTYGVKARVLQVVTAARQRTSRAPAKPRSAIPTAAAPRIPTERERPPRTGTAIRPLTRRAPTPRPLPIPMGGAPHAPMEKAQPLRPATTRPSTTAPITAGPIRRTIRPPR